MATKEMGLMNQLDGICCSEHTSKRMDSANPVSHLAKVNKLEERNTGTCVREVSKENSNTKEKKENYHIACLVNCLVKNLPVLASSLVHDPASTKFYDPFLLAEHEWNTEHVDQVFIGSGCVVSLPFASRLSSVVCHHHCNSRHDCHGPEIGKVCQEGHT